MPLSLTDLVFEKIKRTALVVSLCGASVVAMADPLSDPFTYYQDTETTVPEIARAMPLETDPVKQIMQAVVTVEATVREGARTESTFGTERMGSGVVIDSGGLIATAGYIIAEAETVTVTFANGITDEAEVVAYDDSIGLGLLRPKNFQSTYPLELGESSEVKKEQKVLILPASGEDGAKSVTVGKVQPFTGGWEYMLDNAIHTYPPSTEFSGAALLSEKAELLGIGSLVSIDIDINPKVRVPGNIFIPIDALKSVMGELLTAGRSQSSVKPWLGMETKDTKTGIKVGSVYQDAPAAASGIKAGDKIIAVNQTQVSSLKEMYSRIWTENKPGDKIHLLVLRDNKYANVPVDTVDRYQWLKPQSDKEEAQFTQAEE